MLVALGRRPNTDRLSLESTDIEVDDRGFIQTNEYLEASVLLHEAVLAMRTGLSVHEIAAAIHAHPTLNRILEAACREAATAIDQSA